MCRLKSPLLCIFVHDQREFIAFFLKLHYTLKRNVKSGGYHELL